MKSVKQNRLKELMPDSLGDLKFTHYQDGEKKRGKKNPKVRIKPMPALIK